MKTSNKLLIILLVFVFTVPLFMFMALKSNITAGKYRVERMFENYERGGSVGVFKIIKITAPYSSVFSCFIIPSDSSYYSFLNFEDNNNIKVAHVGDTLHLMYVNNTGPGQNTSNTSLTQLHMKLYVPTFNDIIVDGATVYVDSAGSSTPEANIRLKNNAVLNMCKTGYARVDSTNINGQKAETFNYSSGNFTKVNVESSSGSFNIGSYARIGDLHLKLHGTSSISFSDGCKIEKLRGYVSDSCTITANRNYIRRFDTLIENK